MQQAVVTVLPDKLLHTALHVQRLATRSIAAKNPSSEQKPHIGFLQNLVDPHGILYEMQACLSFLLSNESEYTLITELFVGEDAPQGERDVAFGEGRAMVLRLSADFEWRIRWPFLEDPWSWFRLIGMPPGERLDFLRKLLGGCRFISEILR